MSISPSTASSRRHSQDFFKYERLLSEKDRDYPIWRVRRNTEQLKSLQSQINTTINESYAFTAGTKEMDESYKNLFVDFFREMRGGDHLTNQSGWNLAKALCYEDIADRVERWVYEPEEPDHLETTYRPTEAFNRELMDLLDQCGGFNAQFLEALGRNSKCLIKGLDLKQRDTYISSIPVLRRVFPRCYETLKSIFTDLLSSEWLQEDVHGIQEYTNQKTAVDHPLSLNHEGLRLWNDAKSKGQWQRNWDQQLTKKHENAWKNDLMSTAVSGALSYKTGNPVFIGSQLLRSFTNAISRNTDPEGKDLELQMISTVANAGTGLVSGNLKAVGAGLAFDLADINNCFQERKSGVELSKGQEAGRNIAMLFAKSLITGNFHGDDERYLKEIIGGLTSEALHYIIEESDETTPWGARLLKVIAQHPDIQGLFVDQFMENQRHKKKELPQEESKAEEIRQPIEQEAIERERAIQEQYGRELADYNRELQEWQAKKEAHDQKIVEDKNRLTQKEAEVHQAEKKMLRRFNRYDKKNNKGFSSFLCDVGVQNASKEFNKYWKSREKYKNLFQEFNTLKAEQELTQEHPFAKFYKRPPKRGPIEKAYDKTSKMLGEIGFSGGANVYTASAPEHKPSPFSTYQNPGIHHDLGQKPSEKPSIYQEGLHQIAVERSGLHEMESTQSQSRGNWGEVQSFQNQQIFQENMAFRSAQQAQGTAQHEISQQSANMGVLWGNGVDRNVQHPPVSTRQAIESGIREPITTSHNPIMEMSGLAPFVLSKVIPKRTQEKVKTWIKDYIQEIKNDPLQARKDLDVAVILGAKKAVVVALQAFEQPSLKQRPNTYGLMEASNRFDRWMAGKVNVNLNSRNAQIGMFVGEIFAPMGMCKTARPVMKVGQEAIQFIRSTQRARPLVDRALLSPQNFGRELRAIQAMQNPVHRSGFIGEKGIQQARKAVNLPSWKKMNIKMDHVVSGHTDKGYRTMCEGAKKTLFPENLSRDEIENVIRQAYRYGKKTRTQKERVIVVGEYQGIKIEMWVNSKNKTIETAYPIR